MWRVFARKENKSYEFLWLSLVPLEDSMLSQVSFAYEEGKEYSFFPFVRRQLKMLPDEDYHWIVVHAYLFF